jgi:site-specific recombinase XerD
LVAEFLKAGSYLRNWSPQTIETYQKGLLDYAKTHSALAKSELEKWVVEMRSRGMSPGGVNVHIRTMNSFLSYLREDGIEVPKPLKLMKATLKVKTLLSPEDISKLVKFKPVGRIERRTWTLTLLLLDTGIRINEALTLTVRKVDLDNLMLTVMGKGSKERRVVFSRVLRAALWKSVKSKRPDQLLFSNYDGGKLMRRNIYRDMTTLMRKVGVKVKVHPHLLRHCYASSFIKQGGDIFRLSRLLGHTAVSTTQLYLRSLGVEDLKEGSAGLSPLTLE